MTVIIDGTLGVTTPGLTDTGNATIAGTLATTGNTTAPNLQGPAFSAYANSAQSISNNTWTKLQVNTKLFDTASCFDNTTNYRFTPNVAGYYQVSAAWYSAVSSGLVQSAIYKNGTVYQLIANVPSSAGQVLGVNCLVSLNGTTDYIEFYVNQSQGSAYTTLASRPDIYYFQACLVRSA